jgi:HEPN domain-containing protein
MNKESALLEFYGWLEPAYMYMETAESSKMTAYPQVALGYLQLAAEFAFKAAIVSIGGAPLRARSPFVLATRCRRLVPGLQAAARLYSPAKRKLLCFLDSDYYRYAANAARLPRPAEWKQLLSMMRQFLRVLEMLCRERIDAVFR